MSDLTTEEKVYLIECSYSRGKVYANAYRGFRTKFGQHKVASESTLKRYKKCMFMFCLVNFFNGISLKCIFSIRLLTILYMCTLLTIIYNFIHVWHSTGP